MKENANLDEFFQGQIRQKYIRGRATGHLYLNTALGLNSSKI